MQNLRKIEQNVIKGFVLDKKGQWRPLGDVIAEEVEYLRHLENGEILEGGKWIPLDNASELNVTLLQTDSPEPLLKEKSISEKIVEETSQPEQVKTAEELLPPDEETHEPLPNRAAEDLLTPDEVTETTSSGQGSKPLDPGENNGATSEELIDTVEMEVSIDIDNQTDDAMKTSHLAIEPAEKNDVESVETEVPFDIDSQTDDAMKTSELTIEPAEKEDSETRPFDLDELDPSDTSVLERDSLGIPELLEEQPESDELLSSADFESVISKMENAEIDAAGDLFSEDSIELAASSLPAQASRQPGPFSREGLDEWDKARSRKTKVFISIGGAAIVILLVLLKFLL